MMLLLSLPSISNIYFLNKKSSILKALYIKENSTVEQDGVCKKKKKAAGP